MSASRRDKPLAVVTGAGRGFGAAIATALEQGGWQVIAGVREPDAYAPGEHAGALFQLDVCSARDRAALVRHIHTAHDGRLDLLVNNAGGGLFGAHEDVSEAQLRAQFEVNLFAPALLIRALSPALRAGRGRVITVSSALANWPMPFTSGYCASKSAIDAFSQALHFELAPYGVQVTLVEPGAHKTAFLRKSSWAEPAQGSVYGPALNHYRKFRDDQNQRQDLPGPDKVARVVARLAARPRMPLRVRVGADGHLLALLRRVLPTAALVALKHRVFRRWFGPQAPD
jgi:NAD(P)-dependent dehydrogenase (short-subunit alcohol dehydrogenase family)